MKDAISKHNNQMQVLTKVIQRRKNDVVRKCMKKANESHEEILERSRRRKNESRREKKY